MSEVDIMKRYYLNNYNNVRMSDFLLRNGDIKKDNQGIYTEDVEDYKDYQEQFDNLEYFKTIQSFINVFELEYMIFQDDFTYYVRVIEDDSNNIFSLIYESQDGTKDVNISDVVEIRSEDILCD